MCGSNSTMKRMMCCNKHAVFMDKWVGLQVPDDSVLLAETGSLSQRIDKLGITEDSETVLQSVPLVVTAMYERMRGASSPWGAYLSFLPQLQSMSLPFAWEVSTCPSETPP